jgi:hypothetical protein
VVCMHTLAYAHGHAKAHTLAHARTRARARTHTHTHTHTYIHTNTLSLSRSLSRTYSYAQYLYARFVLNKDGTISPLMNPDLVLGLYPVLKDADKEKTETAKELEKILKTRPDLLRYTQVFDDHLIGKEQLRDLTVGMLHNDMKIPLGHAMAMSALFKVRCM